jgi:hypothetical protein
MLMTKQDSVILLRALLADRPVVHLLLVATLTTLVCKELRCYEEMNIFYLKLIVLFTCLKCTDLSLRFLDIHLRFYFVLLLLQTGHCDGAMELHM